MANERTTFSMGLDGTFYKPTLKAYNKEIKESIVYVKEIIIKTKSRSESRIQQLENEIRKIREDAKIEIGGARIRIKEMRKGYTQEEFDNICNDMKKSLREHVARRIVDGEVS